MTPRKPYLLNKYITIFVVVLLYLMFLLFRHANKTPTKYDDQLYGNKKNRFTKNNLSDNLMRQELRENFLDDDISQDDIDNLEMESNGTSENQQLFFVHNAQCKIPFVEPLTPDVIKIYNPPKFETCTNMSDLITPIFNKNLRRYMLHINEGVIRELLKSHKEILYPSEVTLVESEDPEYNCYYEEIIRSEENDINAKPLPRKYFTQDFVVPIHVEGLLVECHLLMNRSVILQRDAFYLVQHKIPNLNDYEDESQSKQASESTPRKPSVIMFGIDSLSRINFRRTMPTVYDYMRQHEGWYELQGYNKIADNTFPNLMAILSGYTPESSKQICDTSKRGCFDKFPFIWKNFKNEDYITAYGEDESGMGTFHYLKPGFEYAPVDYYLRPFLTAIEDNLEIYRCKGCFMRYCIGRRLTSSYVYDFCHHYMQRFVEERPIFGLFWTNSFSHDDYKMPALMADKILEYFLNFESDGLFESTIMIFFSDHGIRFGDLLNLPQGFLEERLPTMFIWLPPWFRTQYPDYAKGLDLNRNRLTSNYDLHMTLKHIIELGVPKGALKLPPAVDCPLCRSLFYPVADNRTCAEAGIIDHWCACHPYKTIYPKNWIAEHIIERINNYIMKKDLNQLCCNISLHYIHLMERKLNLDDNGIDIIGDEVTYRAKFHTYPNGADFQATVVFNNQTKVFFELDVETISRLDSYRYDSECIDDKEAKKYCICYSSLKNHN